MQFAKDSLYMTLRGRLATVNPARTVIVNGSTRPAIVVAENEPVTSGEPLADVYYLYWNAARVVKRNGSGAQPLVALDLTLAYRTPGASEAGADRGRKLTSLDQDLLAICRPGWTPKRDYTQSPALALGTNIFWNAPEFGDTEVIGADASPTWRKARSMQGPRLLRVANLTIFFFAEAS